MDLAPTKALVFINADILLPPLFADVVVAVTGRGRGRGCQVGNRHAPPNPPLRRKLLLWYVATILCGLARHSCCGVPSKGGAPRHQAEFDGGADPTPGGGPNIMHGNNVFFVCKGERGVF